MKVHGGWCITEGRLLPGGGRGGTIFREEGSRQCRSIRLEVGGPACRRGGDCRRKVRRGGSDVGGASRDGGMLDVHSVDKFNCSG